MSNLSPSGINQLKVDLVNLQSTDSSKGSNLVGFGPRFGESSTVNDKLLTSVHAFDALTLQMKADVRSGVYNSGSILAINAMMQYYADNQLGVSIDFGGPANNFLFVNDPLTIPSTSVHLIGNGCKLTKTGNQPSIDCSFLFLDIQSIQSITNTTVDVPNGSGVTSTSAIVVIDSSVYSIGDYIKVVSDDENSSGEPTRMEGEFARILYIDESINTIYTYAPLRFSSRYITNPRIGRMQSENRVKIQDFVLDHIYPSPTIGWGLSHFQFRGCYLPTVENITVNRSAAQGIRFIGCLFARSRNISFQDMRTSTNESFYGYGVVDSASEYSVHESISATNTRHAFTTVGLGTTAGQEDITSYGQSKYGSILNGTAWNCQRGAWDTHSDSLDYDFINCRAYYPYRGPSGSRMNFQLRGSGNRMIDCVSVGGTGFRAALNDGGLGTSNRNSAFINCEHTFVPEDGVSDRAFYLTGNSDSNVESFLIDSPQVYLNGSLGRPFDATQGHVTIVDPYIVGDYGDSTDNVTVFAHGGNGLLRVRGGTLELDKAGTSPIILVNSYNGVGNDNVDVSGLRVYSAGRALASIWALTASADGMVDILIDDEPVAFTTGSTSDQAWISAISPKGNYNSNVSSPSFSSGNNTLSVSRRGGDHLIFLTNTSSTAAQVTNIGTGRFVGQKLTMFNVNGAGRNITVMSTGTRIAIPADIIVGDGSSWTAMWDGTNWRTI